MWQTIMPPSEPSLRILLATITLTWQVTHCQNARCYDATCDVRGELISSGVSARHCCLELSAGRAYDFGGNQEACYTCEVLGWKEENIYATENSSVEVSFGIVKGSLSVPYTFQVEVTTNTAKVIVMSDVDISSILLDKPAFNLMLQVPHYHDAQSYNRTATLRLTQLAPGMREGQFVYPDVMTLHVTGKVTVDDDGGAGKEDEDNEQEGADKEEAKPSAHDPSSLNRKPGDNSGTPSWAIALSVVLPVVLTILTVTLTVAAAVIYWRRHHLS